MKDIDGESVEESTLTDIRDIKINMALPKEDRILDFIQQVKNPYVFKCGDIMIESVFADNDITLTERLKQYFRMV